MTVTAPSASTPTTVVDSTTPPDAASVPASVPSLPTCLIVLGMAGSGKTTSVQRLKAHLLATQRSGYVVNLDPAVTHLPYAPNIDIRDTVHYKQVMQQYNLGPNGAILTALNLFTTKFDQVIQLLEKRTETTDYVLMDTPGQIEVFTWSASGTIVTETLASLFPTVLVYVVDTPRASLSPATFMANMLYACSILYRTRLPFVLVLNKTDVVDSSTVEAWMRDWQSLHTHLAETEGIMHGYLQSLSLVLDEFYSLLTPVAFSAASGQGTEDVLAACAAARQEYFPAYRAEADRRRAAHQHQKNAKQLAQLEALVRDLQVQEKQAAAPSSSE